MSVTGASASTSIDFGWETGDNSQFSNLECAHPSSQFQVVTSPVREGRYAARVSETGADVWSNGNVRCLDGAYGTGETTGDDYYFGLSVYIPSGGLTDNLIWELHQPSSLYSVAGCGVAPFAILMRNGQMEFRAIGGDCIVGKNYPYWDSDILIPNLNPYPRNQWMDFVIHIKFQESYTGSVQVWARVAGNAWTTTPQITRTNIPTMEYCSACGVHNVKLYTEMGLYPGYSGYTGSDTVYLDSYKRGTSFADVAPGGAGSSPPPPSTTAPTTTTAATTTTAPTTTTNRTTTTTTTTPAPAPPTTTTTTTTATPAPTPGRGNGNGKSNGGGGKRATSVGSSTSVRLLTNATVKPAPGTTTSVKVLTVVLQGKNVQGMHVSLLDQSNRRIPLLKHTQIGSVGITYWRKTLAIGPLGNHRVSLRLHVGRIHLRRTKTLRLRVETLQGSSYKAVLLPVGAY